MRNQRLHDEQRAAIEYFQRETQPVSSRHSDALAIQQGACNPVAVTKRLHDHVQALFRDGVDHRSIRSDAALRLIVHQLAYLFSTSSLDGPGGEYEQCIEECRRRAEEGVAK
jgi:hypothetical protein